MNREIKFRAWHKFRNEIYDVHGWHSEFIFKNTLNGVGNEGNPDKLEDVILMQYTGLKDKNGKEIYEGDIVKNFRTDGSLKIGKIFYNKKRVRFEIDVKGDDFYSFYTAVGDICPQVQIIGNIYEHKNLLDK